MNVVVAIDSFKGSLSSLQAGNAVKKAIKSLDNNADVIVLPIADGGEGTVNALANGLGGEIRKIQVTGPLFEKIDAEYCILPDKNTAVIEMASAAGLHLIPESKRNPMETTTYGVGEIIRDAVKSGCRNFIVGIGGSATNDGGIGMLSALGFEFTDINGKSVSPCAKGLKDLKNISDKNVLPELKECIFKIACDVNNPLCGKNGCSFIFAKQKGATDDEIKTMDSWLKNYAEIVKTVSDKADSDFPGAGAAGGLGFAFLSFTNAILESGIKIVMDSINLEEHIRNADIVVTGEGKLDGQTIMGKAPIGVAKLAKKYDKKVIAFSGVIGIDAEIINKYGIDAYFPILRKITTESEALNPENAYKNLYSTALQVFRLLK